MKKRNVGRLDRSLRVAAGLIISSLAFVGPANPWFLLGLVLVATGIMGWCPPYSILGISTHKCEDCEA
jgi:hypothetical protein